MIRRFGSLATAVNESQINALREFIYSSQKLCVITGAGISTESGIPDYRGVNGSYKKGHKPMKHHEFMGSEYHRKRYWARSLPGWRNFLNAKPNDAHKSLAKLEAEGIIHTIITQNVDRLHQKAGSKEVIDLHGRNDVCVCMNCGYTLERTFVQEKIEEENSEWVERLQLTSQERLRADGDADVGDFEFENFKAPCCPICEGILKPHVVFFGDNVPKERVETCYEKIDTADKLLVVGSSLMVFSAYRFVDAMAKKGRPIAIVNMGHTRAHENGLLISMHIDDLCSKVLTAVCK